MAEHYYQELSGWFDKDYRTVYDEAIASARMGDTLVELGCWKGKSLSYLLVEAKESSKELLVVGVDHFKGSKNEPALISEAGAFNLESICREAADRAGFPYRLIKKASPAAAGEFEDGSLTLVFIDASHDYDSVVADIQAWLPKVRAGGMLAGHDINEEGVAKAVTEMLPAFVARGTCWAFGVSDAPPPLPARKMEKEEKTGDPAIQPAPPKAKWGKK